MGLQDKSDMGSWGRTAHCGATPACLPACPPTLECRAGSPRGSDNLKEEKAKEKRKEKEGQGSKGEVGLGKEKKKVSGLYS